MPLQCRSIYRRAYARSSRGEYARHAGDSRRRRGHPGCNTQACTRTYQQAAYLSSRAFSRPSRLPQSCSSMTNRLTALNVDSSAFTAPASRRIANKATLMSKHQASLQQRVHHVRAGACMHACRRGHAHVAALRKAPLPLSTYHQVSEHDDKSRVVTATRYARAGAGDIGSKCVAYRRAFYIYTCMQRCNPARRIVPSQPNPNHGLQARQQSMPAANDANWLAS